MIKIKDLTVRNFMSVGNQTQAVDFDKQQLTLVLGENLDQGGDDSGSRNGTGKTTIINALSYALYGNALTNIRKNNLINKTNSKGMLVTLSFEKDNHQYRIERGRSPNLLKFYINNQEQVDIDESQGDSRKTQESIDTLLGMSHNMFKHIVALNTYTEPFLSMRTNDQRDIIEQLLGITILSEKADVLKNDIRDTKDNLSQETMRINALQSANVKIDETIDGLKSKQKAWISKRSTDTIKLKEAIDELEHLDIETELESHEKLANWTEHNNSILALNKEKSTLETAQLRANKSVSKVEKDILELDNAACYTCGQELHADKKEEILNKKSKELTDADAYLTEVTDKLNLVVSDLTKIGDINGRPNTFYETAKEAYDHRQNVDNLTIAWNNKKDESDPYQEQVDDNRLTNYLDRLGLPHSVTFQNDLSVEITQLGQDLDFDNLSRGERNRLILGMSFAFRDVWESLYQNINLLFIDELIDSGMDSNGVECALSVLKKMARERDKNIYLISHKDELIGRVNNVLKVIKENGFTSYENDVQVIG